MFDRQPVLRPSYPEAGLLQSHVAHAARHELEPQVIPIEFTQRVMEARLTIEAVEIGANELAVLYANAGVIDEVGHAARRINLVIRAVRGTRFRLDISMRSSRFFSRTRMRASRAYGKVYVTYSFIEVSRARVMVKLAR